MEYCRRRCVTGEWKYQCIIFVIIIIILIIIIIIIIILIIIIIIIIILIIIIIISPYLRSQCWAQASSPTKRAWAIVPTRA